MALCLFMIYMFFTLVGGQELFDKDSCEDKPCNNYNCLKKRIEELEKKNVFQEELNDELQKQIVDKDEEIVMLKQEVKDCECINTTESKVNNAYLTNNTDTRGTEFTMVFIRNYVNLPEKIELLMTSHEYEVKIELISSVLGVSRIISAVNQSVRVTLDSNIVIGTTIESKGLYIKSSNPISVHGLSVLMTSCCTSGGFTALPNEMLGTQYIVASYHPYRWSQVGIVAVYDETNINVTLNTTGTVKFNGSTYRDNDTIMLSLQRLHTVLIRSTHDLTGTVIKSDKIIAVSAGVDSTSFPGTDLECVVDSMPPVNQWGHMYVLPNFHPSNKMVLRVVPSDHDVQVEIRSNDKIESYRENKAIEVSLSSADIHFVYCSKPCLVVQFCADPNLNPFMVAIPSIEQFLNKYDIMRPTVKSFDDYISGTIETKYLNGLLYEGISISGNIMTGTDRNGVSWSSFAFPIINNFSVIRHLSEGARFGLVQYGFNLASYKEAYAFPVALSSIDSN